MSNLGRYLKRHHVALLALFFALGGTSFAAANALLPKNSVGSAQVRNGSLQRLDLSKKAVRSLRGNRGLRGLRGLQGAKGTTGAQGVQGPKGTTGAQGVVGAATVEFTQAAADLANGAEVSVDAYCPAGQQGIAGGVRGDLTNSELTKVTASRPIISSSNTGAPADGGTFTGWRGTFVNENNGAGIRPEVWVACVPAPA
jgi:collagen triple helix repeat protein